MVIIKSLIIMTDSKYIVCTIDLKSDDKYTNQIIKCACGKTVILNCPLHYSCSEYDFWNGDNLQKIYDGLCKFQDMKEAYMHLIIEGLKNGIELPSRYYWFNEIFIGNQIIKHYTFDRNIAANYLNMLLTENQSLKKENDELKLALYYHPNNEAAKEAEQHFESLIKKN